MPQAEPPASRRHGPTSSHGSWLAHGIALLLAALAGCASAPPPTPPSPPTPRPAAPPVAVPADKDGPSANPPENLQQVPDAEPRVEAIRSGGPNKPYEVLGQHYTPLASDAALSESGLASWYGRKFHGRPTASGEIYDMHAMSAAHRTMPIPSYARVRNPANGRQVIVRINDRGPFHQGRIIDLSYTAALKLGVLSGVAPVEVQRLTHDDIRRGRWRDDETLAVAVAPVAEAVVGETAAAAAAPAAANPGEAPAMPAPVTVGGSAAPPAPAESAVETMRARTAAGRGFWLQFGAFSQRQSALDLRQQLMRELSWIEPLLAVFTERSGYRVQAGPYASRADAQAAVDRVRQALPTQPLLLQHK